MRKDIVVKKQTEVFKKLHIINHRITSVKYSSKEKYYVSITFITFKICIVVNFAVVVVEVRQLHST